MNHQFAPLTHAPAYMKVCKAIETEILSGKLKEGAVLPTETVLCEQFGVTRSTVREGIRLLETSGLVARGAAKRLIVCRPNVDDIALSTSRALTFSGVTFREAWEALSLFQPQLAAEATKKFGPKDIKKLKAIHKQLSNTNSRDFDIVVEHTDAFFNTLAEGLQNSVALALSSSLNMLIDASLRQVIINVPDGRKRILKAQRELIDAIEKRNAEKAHKWMARHIDDLKRGYKVADISMDAKIV